MYIPAQCIFSPRDEIKSSPIGREPAQSGNTGSGKCCLKVREGKANGRAPPPFSSSPSLSSTGQVRNHKRYFGPVCGKRTRIKFKMNRTVNKKYPALLRLSGVSRWGSQLTARSDKRHGESRRYFRGRKRCRSGLASELANYVLQLRRNQPHLWTHRRLEFLLARKTGFLGA